MQAIWSELRLRPVDEIYATLDRLAAGVSGAVPEEGGPLKAADLDQLTKAGFTFGGHTLTHPPLSKIAPDLAAAEIASGKEAVKQMIGAPISGFAYPYGDCHAGVARQVAVAGFSWACTTHAAAVANGCDPFLLPRVKVGNISGKELLSHLSALRAGPG